MKTDHLHMHQRTWVLGGLLLLVATLLEFTATPFGVTAPWSGVLSPLAFGAACMTFAIGGRRENVTARQPLGMIALVLLGAWTPVAAIVRLIQTEAALPARQVFWLVDSVVSFALALVAVVSIGRARVVPEPWNWAPAWCVAAVVAVRVIDTALIAVPAVNAPIIAPLLAFLAALIGGGSALGLGILAVVLGTHRQRRPNHPTTSAIRADSAR